MKSTDFATKSEITWCPGCPNFMIMEAAKQTMADFVNEGKFAHTDFAMTADIGCHAKMFDYLNISGIYGLHGRAIPTATGMKIGNPNLKVLTFAGDGATYSEGMTHFMHAFRYNVDTTLIVHDNQSFSLTKGQPTATSQKGFIAPSEPLGSFDKPFNPIQIALACNATFIARTNARDIEHMKEIFKKAILHQGFSYIEVMQDCLIFNLEINNKDKMMYKIKDNTDIDRAKKLSEEYDYNSKKGKIPLGIIYQKEDLTLEEKWPLLKKELKEDTTDRLKQSKKKSNKTSAKKSKETTQEEDKKDKKSTSKKETKKESTSKK